jgi:transposase-like protein
MIAKDESYRSHFNASGNPKVPYSKKDAEVAAHDKSMDHYKCLTCGKWHLATKKV